MVSHRQGQGTVTQVKKMGGLLTNQVHTMGPKAVKASEYSSMEVVGTCEVRAPVKKYIPLVPHNKLLRLSMID